MKRKPIDNRHLLKQFAEFDDSVLVPRFEKKIDIEQNPEDKGKSFVVGEDGKVELKSIESVKEVLTLPEEKENVIYNIKGASNAKELSFLSNSLKASFVEGSKIPTGIGLYEIAKDFDITIDGFRINADIIREQWTLLADNNMYGYNFSLIEDEAFIPAFPSFYARLSTDESVPTSILYILTDKPSINAEIKNVDFIKDNITLAKGTSITIPQYCTTIESDRVYPATESFENDDVSYNANLRLLTNKNDGYAYAICTYDVSLLPEAEAAKVYSKDIRLLTEFDVGEIGKVKTVNNNEPDENGNITVDVVKEVSTLPEEKENTIYKIVDDSRKVYTELGNLEVVQVPGAYVGDLYVSILTPFTCDINGTEYEVTPDEEMKFIFGSETDLPAIAYMIDISRNELHFRGISNKEETFVLRKVDIVPQNTGVYAKDVKLLTENDTPVEEVEDAPETFENKVYLKKIGSSTWIIPCDSTHQYIDDMRNMSWLGFYLEDSSITEDAFNNFKVVLNGFTWDFSKIESTGYSDDKIKLYETELDDGSPVSVGKHSAVLMYTSQTIALYIASYNKDVAIGSLSMTTRLGFYYAYSGYSNPYPVDSSITNECTAKVIEGRDKGVEFPLNADYEGLSFTYTAATRIIKPHDEDVTMMFLAPENYKGTIFPNVWVKDTLVTSKEEFENFKENVPQPDMSKVVTTDTAQTITGKKTLKDVDVNGNFNVRKIEDDVGSSVAVSKTQASIASEDDSGSNSKYSSVSVNGSNLQLKSSTADEQNGSITVDGPYIEEDTHNDYGNGHHEIITDSFEVKAGTAKVNDKNIVRSVQGCDADEDGAVEIESLTELLEKVPAQASSTNQLADKEFVNSSIATNTANYKGNFDDVSKLPTEGITNNDYAYVTSIDTAGNTIYARYKYNAESSEWKFEYNLNNTGFTAEQFAAINSGITATSYGGTSAKATADGNGNNIANTYLPRNTTSDVLPQFSGAPSFLLGIEPFNDNGTVKWQSSSSVKVGEATKATQDADGNDIRNKYLHTVDLGSKTIDEVKTYTNTSGAFCGSASISNGPAGNCWYNILWIPHRNGIGDDNPNYGQLFLYPMTVNSATFYRYQKNSNVWTGPFSYSYASGSAAQADLNTYKTPGNWRITSGTNLPPNMENSYGQLLVLAGDTSDWVTQIFAVEGDDNNDVWYRKWNGDGWNSWTKFLTKDNFSYSNGTLTINM